MQLCQRMSYGWRGIDTMLVWFKTIHLGIAVLFYLLLTLIVRLPLVIRVVSLLGLSRCIIRAVCMYISRGTFALLGLLLGVSTVFVPMTVLPSVICILVASTT